MASAKRSGPRTPGAAVSKVSRLVPLVLLLCGASALPAAPSESEADERPASGFQTSLAALAASEAPLRAARAALIDCEEGCHTPTEAAAMAFAAGEGEALPGRFILDIRGGGQSLAGALERLFFVNSQYEYATPGTLTIAFEPDALYDLLHRPSVCGARDVVDGRIIVKACRPNASFDLNMFTMMQRLAGKRVVVDGAVQLQWIDYRHGAVPQRPDGTAARPREGRNPGYYQVWVRVEDARQVSFIADE